MSVCVCVYVRAGFRTGQAGQLPWGRVGIYSSTTEGCPGASTCLNPALVCVCVCVCERDRERERERDREREREREHMCMW